MLFDINAKLARTNKLDASVNIIDDVKQIQIRSKASELTTKLFKKIAPGTFVEFCTAGEFSVHHLLQHLINISGPANVYLSTWTIKEEPARVLHYLKKSGQIKDLYCVFDYRIRTQDAKHYHFIESLLTGHALTKCHAKVIAIEGEKCDFAIVSSANLSSNPRIEAGYVAYSTKSMLFHKGWIMDSINGKKIYS